MLVRRDEPPAVRQGVLAAIIGIRARMAVAFEATSRSFAGQHAVGKAVQWGDDSDDCKQRYGDVNATSHLYSEHSKPGTGQDPANGKDTCVLDPRVQMMTECSGRVCINVRVSSDGEAVR